MGPLLAGIVEKAVQGTFTTAASSVYLWDTDTGVIVEKLLQSHSYHIHHGLLQVPSENMQIHSISSELPDGCAEPSPGSADWFWSPENSQHRPCLTADQEDRTAPDT